MMLRCASKNKKCLSIFLRSFLCLTEVFYSFYSFLYIRSEHFLWNLILKFYVSYYLVNAFVHSFYLLAGYYLCMSMLLILYINFISYYLTNSFIVWVHFIIDFIGFSMHTIMSSANRDRFHFFPSKILFY